MLLVVKTLQLGGGNLSQRFCENGNSECRKELLCFILWPLWNDVVFQYKTWLVDAIVKI